MTRSLLCLMALVSATNLAAQDTPLRRGEGLSGSLNTGDTVRYVIDAEADHFVRGAVDQISVDVIVRVLRPDGRMVRTWDGPGRGPETFQIETDTTGAYTVEVIPFEEEEGDYVITLELLERVAADPKKLADQLLSAYDGDDMPGAVVSVFKDGETLFEKAYGMANLTYGIPFEVDTPTNIGSTSKQFTAFAVMLLVERGEVSLDDDLRDHIPELPDLGETVTVRHILTHTSGYREFLNLLTMTGRRLDHGDYIGRDELISIVQRQPALQNAPGAEWNYNNTAFGLAAVLVERISGMTFPEFMAENVFGPIGMDRSMVRASPEHIVPGKAEGYTRGDDGTYRELGDLGGAIGAGGIYTTVGDLEKWVQNFTTVDVGSEEIFEQMMTTYVLNDGDSTGYGFGLSIDEQRGLKRVQHGGADVAHRSMLAYYPEIGAGITTQSNNANFDGSIAFRLAEAFFEDYMEPEESDTADEEGVQFDASTYDAESFDDFAGRYALDARPNFILTFSRDDDTFYAQATGQPQIEIVPTSVSTFSLIGVEASVTFNRDADGEVDAVTLHQGGADNRATRLAGDAQEEWAPTVADLGAFVGRFFSEEIETFYDVVLEEEELVLKQRRLDDRDLDSGETDTFNAGGMEVSFERDRNDQVIAFYMSNVRTRGVRFERVR